MKRWRLFLGCAFVASTAAAAPHTRAGKTPEEWAYNEDTEEKVAGEPLPPVDKHWAFGVRAGTLPPSWFMPELYYRPISVLAIGVMGVYLPAEVYGAPADYWAASARVRVDFTPGNENTGFMHVGMLYVSEIADDGERLNLFPITVGYLLRDRYLEVEIGGGILFYSSNKGGNFFKAPPLLPALELAMRYRL